MMMALLLYCYASGIFSSRRIEAATHRHVSVRYIAGNTHPDHETIATFRRVNKELVRGSFVRVLELARDWGCCNWAAWWWTGPVWAMRPSERP